MSGDCHTTQLMARLAERYVRNAGIRIDAHDKYCGLSKDQLLVKLADLKASTITLADTIRTSQKQQEIVESELHVVEALLRGENEKDCLHKAFSDVIYIFDKKFVS